MRKILMLLCGMLLLYGQLLAQSKTITGKVTDESGNPVPNASVTVKGTSLGTTSKEDGSYSLTVPSNSKTLTISAVGLDEQEIAIGDKTSILIAMTHKQSTLQEVVVTSLGISRDKRSLGYATQNLKADQFNDRGQVNIANALQGKVAGVNITNASGGAGASVNINIRGISSFTGNNQPLFVIDGIPISNDVDRTNGGPNGTLGDNQPPNRALDLDMNNIESINILKGPAASVLYGSRAAAGAIIITTKKGSGQKGRAEIVVSSNESFQRATGLPKLQNEYGQGTNGAYVNSTGNSWGPKFGSKATIANGLLLASGDSIPYNPYANNIKNFFETGILSDNNISINSGDTKQNFSFSAGYLYQKGIMPNTGVKRASVKFGGNTVLRDKIKLGGSVTFTNTLQDGVLGGNGQSALAVVQGVPRSVDLQAYKRDKSWKNLDGTNNYAVSGTENPYFGVYENPIKSNLYRLIGIANLGYDITSWLNVSYRLGVDAYTDRRKQIFAVNSGRVPQGLTLDNPITRSEVNGDLIITAKKNDIIKGLNVSGLLGNNINQRRFQSVQLQGNNVVIPDFTNISSALVYTVGSQETSTLQRLVGYYAQASFDYNNYLFLELTGRADQSSTLPKGKNLYFYPSVSAGLVFTDAFQLQSDVLNYGKVRVSAATVGRDAPPYLLTGVYTKGSYGNNVAQFDFPLTYTPAGTPSPVTVAGFGASTRLGPNQPLKPEFTTSYEVGLNASLFRNRVTVDVAYFDQVSKNQIIDVGLAPSTGYSSVTSNVGKMTNKGIEALLTVTAINNRDLRWEVSGNFTRIRNKVVSIAPGITSFAIPGSAFTGSIPTIQEGSPYGVIVGGLITKTPAGDRIINPGTGTYLSTVANQVLANPNPDYQLGFTNTLKVKSFSLSFTFDFIKGGQVLSFTAATYKGRGMLKETAVDRDQPHILPGVVEDPNNKGTYIANTIQIPAQTYWGVLGGLQSEFNVYDATTFRMRDISIGYDLPHSLMDKLKIQSARIGVFANNVFYIAPNAFFDPQLNTQGAGNIRGLDLQSVPNARTVGAGLKVSL
ncbi:MULTISPECIES: SusC/RagA family TonB-linked outer membrane protein [Niastella]|uniref:SusC/RagA family TonB-linked outer membrane protein n=1 Tax=Niastella soli TaxID=2821487 RepID=A0ABS3YMT6_9BACT|nr:SusC/RagA family TonB-linked outer membrane protein [Niastella soli]MBO9199187.1 SusC/RagA family TonB-linked outer membrane protein [Niastella soli]